jgi:diguanylate cyclase (GGDEF)-like protein
MDTVGRWGGEEFLVVLPETDEEEAARVAERIRAQVERLRTAVAPGRRVTCSIGVASCPRHAVDAHALVELADRAMYRAKREGRNRVVSADRDAAPLGA